MIEFVEVSDKVIKVKLNGKVLGVIKKLFSGKHTYTPRGHIKRIGEPYESLDVLKLKLKRTYDGKG